MDSKTLPLGLGRLDGGDRGGRRSGGHPHGSCYSSRQSRGVRGAVGVV